MLTSKTMLRDWVRVLAGAVLLIVMAAAPSAAQEMTMDAARKLALDLVNQSRAEKQLPPLKLEAKLNQAAQGHALDMYKRRFFAHVNPNGKGPADRFQAAGGSKWLLTAENIASCEGCRTPLQEFIVRQQHTGWMHSPGHRANILLKGIDNFGYGIIVDQTGRLYAVQTFSGPGTPAVTNAADAKAVTPQQQVEMITASINAKRKAAGAKPLVAAPGLIAAAKAIAPAPGDKDFKIRNADDILSVVPEADKEKWQYMSMVSGHCGGCGVQMVAGDVSSFAGQWLGSAKTNKYLLDGKFTHVGFAIVADGNGRKTAVCVVGGPTEH